MAQWQSTRVLVAPYWHPCVILQQVCSLQASFPHFNGCCMVATYSRKKGAILNRPLGAEELSEMHTCAKALWHWPCHLPDSGNPGHWPQRGDWNTEIPPTPFRLLRTSEEPHWIRSRAHQVQLPASHSGSPDAAGGTHDHKRPASWCHSFWRQPTSKTYFLHIIMVCNLWWSFLQEIFIKASKPDATTSSFGNEFHRLTAQLLPVLMLVTLNSSACPLVLVLSERGKPAFVEIIVTF